MMEILLKKGFLSLPLRLAHSTKSDLVVGATHIITKTIRRQDVEEFARLSGDTNPVHLPSADSPGIVHGALLNSFVSSVIGTKLPGPGTLVVSQTLRFPKPCLVGETVSVAVELTDLRKVITCAYKVSSTKDKTVFMEGEARLVFKMQK